MQQTLRGVDGGRLERSCTGDSIRFASSAPDIERAEVLMRTWAYEPHRHDTYGVGITLAGAQTFRYRGERRVCLPGQLHVLHPDVTHDGAPGTAEGLRYRILYIAPALVHAALGGGALPFVADPVQKPTPATRRVAALLADLDEPLGELRSAEIAAAVADTLRGLAGTHAGTPGAIDESAVRLAREYLDAHARERIPASTLERVTGLDRFTLARHFRRAFGTSPDRYRTQRRLALARQEIEGGRPLAQAAARSGFADQAHMTRQFKRTYGLTPAAWAAIARR